MAFFSKDSEKEEVKSVEPLKADWSVRISPELTKCMMTGLNPATYTDFATLNAYHTMSKKKVWIYSVSRVPFSVDHPILSFTKVNGRKEDEEYSVVTSIPEVLLLPRNNPDAGETQFVLQDGKRIAMDFINPDNLGLDQDFDLKLGRKGIGNINRNLGVSGVFWSVSNPPKKSEIKAARRRMEKHYEFLTRRIMTLAMLNPLELRGLTPEDREAYSYMQEKTMTQEKTQNVRK